MKAPDWLKKFKGPDNRKQKRARSPVQDEVSIYQSHSRADEDFDYMHDSLTSVEDNAHTRSRLKRREHTKTKPLKEVMHDALEEGLDRPLDKGNIGFQMVQHLSFTPV